MAARKAKPLPVTAAEVKDAVLLFLATAFDEQRPCDGDTVRAGLGLAQQRLIMLELEASGKRHETVNRGAKPSLPRG